MFKNKAWTFIRARKGSYWENMITDMKFGIILCQNKYFFVFHAVFCWWNKLFENKYWSFWSISILHSSLGVLQCEFQDSIHWQFLLQHQLSLRVHFKTCCLPLIDETKEVMQSIKRIMQIWRSLHCCLRPLSSRYVLFLKCPFLSSLFLENNWWYS